MTRNDTPEGDTAVAGNLIVADGGRMRANLRCDGHARLGKGALIEGDVDVRGTLAVRAGARITGAVTCGAEVDWHPAASAASLRSAGAFRVDGEPVAAALEAAEGVWPADGEGSS